MVGISSKAAGALQNKEKTFQGQRFDDELGLNWSQFKWRNHDVQTGRFIEIDPLCEKYVYNSTYAFSENKVTTHVELEGLEAVLPDPTGQPAVGVVNKILEWIGDLKNGRKDIAEGSTEIAHSNAGDYYEQSVISDKFHAISGNLKQTSGILQVTKPAAELVAIAAGTLVGMEIPSELPLVTGSPFKSPATFLYRAVSPDELADATINGFRTKTGGYETGKLFATSAEDAAQFGKSNFYLEKIPADRIANTITKVRVPNSVMQTATNFEADGMKAVAIPSNQLKYLAPLEQLNYSPKPANPYLIPGFW